MIQKNINKLFRRKEAEDKLRHREHRYRIMIESNPLGVFLMDHEGVIQDCNDAFVELMGSSREKLIGFNATESTTPEMQQVIKKALAGEVGIFEGEYTSITGSKTAHLRIVYNPVNPGGNSPTDIIATVEDVSARKRAEEETRTASERMKAIFSSIKDPILVHPYTSNGHGIFSEVNDIACTRYGYTRDEFLQISVKNLLKQDSGESLLAPGRLEEIMTKGHMVFETVHVAKNGEEFPVEVSVCTMDQAEKKYVLAVVRDMTESHIAQLEKTRLEAQLQQAQKMEAIGQLAGGVAHDFNNMLGVILGHAEMVMGQLDSAHSLYADLEEIRKAASRSADLTRQLLAFARKQTIAPKVVDINETIKGFLKMLQRIIGEDIDLAWIPGTGLWPIKVDPSQMDQILANLCVNARDSILGVGKIIIETSNGSCSEEFCSTHSGCVSGDYVKISVSDNGHGMDKLTLTHIFEPFFTTKEVGAGTGLGLATVYGVVKQHNGFIDVYSEPEKGTIFKIYLPRHKEVGIAGQTSKEGVVGAAVGGNETILLVEDEPAILKMTARILQSLGYDVITASNPGEAVRLVKEFKAEIHLLMTDVIMPGMNGRDLADRLMTLKKGMKCLFMSGYTSDIVANQGVLSEGVSFIQKPFSQKELAAKIRDVFNEEKSV